MGNSKFFTIWINGRKKSVCPKCFDYKKPQGARTHNENCKGEWESYFDKFAEFLKESFSDLRISEKNYPNFVNSFKLENPLSQEDDPGDDNMSKKDQEKEKEPDEEKDKKTYGADPKEWKKDFDEFKDDIKNTIKDLIPKKDSGDDKDKDKDKDQKKESKPDDEEFDKKDLFLIMLVIVIIVALVGGYVGLELKGGEESPLKKKTDEKQNK